MNTLTILTTGYFLYNINIISIIRIGKDMISVPRYIYNKLKNREKNINIKKCLANQAIEIIDLKFKLLELENPNTTYGYEIIN